MLPADPTFGIGRDTTASDAIVPARFHHPLQKELHRETMSRPVGIGLLSHAGFSHNTIGYRLEGGSLTRLQTPRQEQELEFTAIGLHVADKWRLYGEFAYRRGNADSVKWLLSELPENGMPYYFASPNAGDWRTERYDLKGVFDLNLFKTLNVGASVEVRYFNGARTNDPRPSAESYRSRYHLFASYSVLKTKLSAMAGFGYGTGDNHIVFNHSGNDQALAYMPYEFMGYGMTRKTQTFHNRDLETDCYSRHFALQAHRMWNNHELWLRVGFDRTQDTIRRSRSKNIERSTLSIYTENRKTAEAGWAWQYAPHIHLHVLGTFQTADGFDNLINILKGQKNYVYHATRMSLKALLTRESSALRTDCGLALSLRRERKQDGSTEHDYRQSEWEATLYWGQNRKLRRGYRFFYTATQGLMLPAAELNYPDAQENIFTTEFALPVRDYYRMPRSRTTLCLGTGKELSGKYFLAFTLDYGLELALCREERVPGSVRHQLKAAVHLDF